MDVFGYTINCGTSVIPECEDLNIPWGEDWTFEMLLGDLIDSAGALVKYGVSYIGDSLGENLLRAVNALRCALTNLGTNAWNVIAAGYWTLVGVGQESTAREYLDIGYQWICTCQEDAKTLIKALTGEEQDGKQDSNDKMGSCSESGSVKKADAKEDRKKREDAQADAAAVALADATRARAEQEKEGELQAIADGEGGLAALEARERTAFDAFNALSITLDA